MAQISYRKLQVNEAQRFWDMMNQLDNETDFMMYEPGEREKTAKDLKPIERLIKNAMEGTDFLLAAEADNQIAGFISAQRGGLNRIRHTAYVVTGIRAGCRRNGIGTHFFKELDSWSKDVGVTRLELTVMCSNTIAKRLYEKNGFAVEGIKRKSMFDGKNYMDEFYMAKLL